MKTMFVCLLLLTAFPFPAASTSVHYVSSDGSHVHPFTNWITAATNIQAAVDACADGHTVYVTNGTYLLTNEIAIDVDIRLKSINGPEETVMVADYLSRCLNLGSSTSVVSGFTISKGYSHTHGGGVYVDGVAGMVSNCILRSNGAIGDGGAMYGGVALDCLFQGNGTDFNGGGKCRGTAKNCAFIGNSVSTLGGAMYDCTAIDCTVISNEAASGGGMAFSDATGCTLLHNRSLHFGDDRGQGGGMYQGSASNCVFGDNWAYNGGGMYAGEAKDCIFTNNRTIGDRVNVWYGGGAAHSSTLKNCIVKDNYAWWLGGGLLYGRAENCLVIGNSAADNGREGDLTHTMAYNCTIGSMIGSAYNCIVGWTTSGGLYNSCCAYVEEGVEGNITGNPLFVDPANGDYRLQSNSPCINWGNNSYMTNGFDLDGNPRMVEGHVDIGCYEYQDLLQLTDSDDDGLPDEWEHRYFGGNTDPDRDDDGDGYDNGEEQLADTSPTNLASFFMMSRIEPYEIEWWPCATGRYYHICWTTNLFEPFMPLATNLQYPQNTYTDIVHSTSQQAFYKARVSWVPVDACVPEGMVRIPAGTNTVNDGIYSNYTLVVEQPFLMDACEVSATQWLNVTDWAISHAYDFSMPYIDWFLPARPKAWINWYDCAKWCNARSQIEGRTPCYYVSGSLFKTGQVANVQTDYEANGFRLPTQAEWEYAARGGFSNFIYPWGNTISAADANYIGSSAKDCGSYPPNAFGLYDIVGNVWEWCNNITVAASPGVDEMRARAGGGYGDPGATYMKCGIHAALPSQGFTDNAYHSLGFRTICH